MGPAKLARGIASERVDAHRATGKAVTAERTRQSAMRSRALSGRAARPPVGNNALSEGEVPHHKIPGLVIVARSLDGRCLVATAISVETSVVHPRLAGAVSHDEVLGPLLIRSRSTRVPHGAKLTPTPCQL